MFRDIPWTRLNTARFALITAALGKTKSFTLKSQSHFIKQILQNYFEESQKFSETIPSSQTDIKRNFFETSRRRNTKQFEEELYNKNRLCQG
jgi:hypothetical protein